MNSPLKFQTNFNKKTNGFQLKVGKRLAIECLSTDVQL